MKPLSITALIVGVLSGLSIACIDTRPHWDDTGISVAMILIAAFVFRSHISSKNLADHFVGRHLDTIIQHHYCPQRRFSDRAGAGIYRSIYRMVFQIFTGFNWTKIKIVNIEMMKRNPNIFMCPCFLHRY